MKSVVALWFLVAGSAGAQVGDRLEFSVDHSGTVLVSYKLTVQEDGSAVYAASYPPERPKYSPYAVPVAAGANTEVSVSVLLSPATTKMLFERVRATNGLAGGCESTAKNIAKTGVKALTFTSAGPVATCRWNYTEDKNVIAMAKTFEGIALTLDEGRKLSQDHKYDRLALDPDVQFLFDSVKQGTAIELGTIAPTLHAIADDPQVLERVRSKAEKLLSQAAAAQ